MVTMISVVSFVAVIVFRLAAGVSFESTAPESPLPESLSPATSSPVTPSPVTMSPTPSPTTDNAFYVLLMPNTTEVQMFARLVAALNTTTSSVNVFARGLANVSQSILFVDIAGAPPVVTLGFVNFTVFGMNWSTSVSNFDALSEQFLVSMGIAFGTTYTMSTFSPLPVFSCLLLGVNSSNFRSGLANFLSVPADTVLLLSSGPVTHVANLVLTPVNFTFVGTHSSEAAVTLLLADSLSLTQLGVLHLVVELAAAPIAPSYSTTAPSYTTTAPATMSPRTAAPVTQLPQTPSPVTASPVTFSPMTATPSSTSGHNAFYVLLLPNVTEAQFVANLASVLNSSASAVHIIARGTVNVSQRMLFVDLPQWSQTVVLTFANFSFVGSDSASLAASCDALTTQKLVSIGAAYGASYFIPPTAPTRSPYTPLFSCRLVNSNASEFRGNVARLVNVSSDQVLIVDIRAETAISAQRSSSAVAARKMEERSVGSNWLVNFSFVGDSAPQAAARLLALSAASLAVIGVENLAVAVPAATTSIPSLAPTTVATTVVPSTVLSTSGSPFATTSSPGTSTSAPVSTTAPVTSNAPPIADNTVDLGLAIGLPVGIAVVMLCFGSCWCWRMQQQARMQYQGGDFNSLTYPQTAQHHQWGPPLEMQACGPPPPPGGFSTGGLSQQTSSYSWQQRQQQQVIHPVSSTLNAQQDMQVQRIEQQIPFSYPS